jgi:mRNA interferase YafQ
MRPSELQVPNETTMKAIRDSRAGKDLTKLKVIIETLASAEAMPVRHKDHPLKGTLKDCRECHDEGDWLLIYRLEGSELCLVRTGSHADLFE